MMMSTKPNGFWYRFAITRPAFVAALQWLYFTVSINAGIWGKLLNVSCDTIKFLRSAKMVKGDAYGFQPVTG